VSGIAFALTMPSRAALVPRLVPVADTMNGIVLSNGVFSSAQITGPALAGVIIGALGEGAALVTTVVLALPAPLLLLRVREERAPERNGETLSPFQEFLQGFRYVKAQHVGPHRWEGGHHVRCPSVLRSSPVICGRCRGLGISGRGRHRFARGGGLSSLQKGDRPTTVLRSAAALWAT
jgi:MFS family permease